MQNHLILSWFLWQHYVQSRICGLPFSHNIDHCVCRLSKPNLWYIEKYGYYALWNSSAFKFCLRKLHLHLTSIAAQLVKNPLAPAFNSWVGKIPCRRDRLPTPVFLGFPDVSDGKESAGSVGDLGLVPGLERSPGEWNSYQFQYSGLENSMDCIVHEISKSQTW